MLLLSWMNCWFARAASVHEEFAASHYLCLKQWIACTKLVPSCGCDNMGKNSSFPASLYCPFKCEIQAGLGSAVLLHSAHADLMFLRNIFCFCTDLKIRKKQNVILISSVQLKRIFMCFYNLTLSDSFFPPFECTGMEGKLG